MIYDLYKGTGAALEVEGGRLNKAVNHGSRSFPDSMNKSRKNETRILIVQCTIVSSHICGVPMTA